MGKPFARIAFYSVFLAFLLSGKAAGRYLHYDGFSDRSDREEESFLHLKGMDSSEEHCEQMYGFLPCSVNLPGHIFLILVYEYLLYHGESYAGGDGRIFRVFGENFVATSFFQLLDSLPDSIILLASGLSSSNKKAQEYVVTGVGLLAGSSIFLLTILWGMCLIFGSRKYFVKLKPGSKESNHLLQLLTGSGVLTDSETSHHAKIMLFSLLPFIIILIPWPFGVSYSSQEYNIFVLISLSVAVLCLFSYFIYQYYDLRHHNNRIQKRRLEYAEVERKVEMHVPFYEVRALMLNREKHLMRRQKDLEKMIAPATNDHSMIKRDDFLDIFKKWLDSTRHSMDNPYSDKEETKFNQVAQLLLEEKIKLMKLLSRVMKRNFRPRKDGTPDESAIDSFFEKIDADGDSSISPSELKDFIMNVKNEDMHVQNEDMLMDELVDEDIADLVMTRLDYDGNGNIDKKEFKTGVTKWLKEIERRESEENSSLAEEEKKKFRVGKAKARKDEMLTAIVLVGVGIFILTVLAEPLIQSVRNFSESVNIEPFYISFVLIPVATNARTAIAAMRAAKQEKHHTTSLTFSEIYHKVFMNNILGFSVLVSVLYFRGLTWHFSVEVLALVVVCTVMGLLASFRSKFPNWALLIAFPLYPLSLVMVYYIDDTFQSS